MTRVLVFEIAYYRFEDGQAPVEDFIDTLEVKMQAKVLQQIKLLIDYGCELREPYSSCLEDGILELRIKQSSNITRNFYFFCRSKKIILTHGFTKKTQKRNTI